MREPRPLLLTSLLACTMLLAACGHRRPAADAAAPAPKAERTAKAPKADPAPATAATPAAAPSSDSAAQAAEDAKAGDVRGTPAPDSKFLQLRMGMGLKEVIRLLGKPDDKLSYITGKGMYWSLGSDTYRHEYVYKGLGRLTFAAKGGFSTDATLFRIIHNANEPAKRTGPPPADSKS